MAFEDVNESRAMDKHLLFRTGNRQIERPRATARSVRGTSESNRQPSPGPGRASSPAVVMPRLRSVDVFRGLTVAGMVIVNNPGDWNAVYWPLLHAEWNGWTPTDLIFPFFLFIVGVAIAFSPASTGSLAGVFRRTAVIFGLGLFLAGFPFFNVTTWRVPGVLQRIAICYLAAVVITRVTAPSGAETRAHIKRLAAAVAALVIGYAVLMLWVPVPGSHAGDLSPSGNLGAWLDRALLKGHLWKAEWDPEGLLSTMPAIATTLLGVMAGLSIRRAATVASWRRALISSGIAGVVLGLLWNSAFPINKSLWTSSYVLFTGGLAAVSLALCSLWCDETGSGWRIRTSEPFVALGRNAILLFVLSGLFARSIGIAMIDPVARVSVKTWIYTNAFAPFGSPKNASLLFALANLALLYALLTWLHWRRWYWRA
jgi:predicted acyltransferase